jgi:hypothetical protein
MENGLVTADGTKILTVEEYERFINVIPESMKAIFEINTITGLRACLKIQPDLTIGIGLHI